MGRRASVCGSRRPCFRAYVNSRHPHGGDPGQGCDDELLTPLRPVGASGATPSPAMERPEGLVQRRNVSQRSNGNGGAGGAGSGGASPYSPEDDVHDDVDSKETRLTLMEEVLLLGLKDKEVGFVVFAPCDGTYLELCCDSRFR